MFLLMAHWLALVPFSSATRVRLLFGAVIKLKIHLGRDVADESNCVWMICSCNVHMRLFFP